MATWLQIPLWTDLFDILLVAGMAWLVIQAVRRTRARAALVGLAVLAVVYVVARSVGLPLATLLLESFFAVVVLVLVVLFQEDLRRAFEQLGSWRLGAEGDATQDSDESLDTIVRSVARMATARTGALIVLPGRESIDRHVDGGIRLGGRVSEPLLLSLFDPSSPGHDGAVVVREGRVERFAVHLPLSVDHEQLGAGGTRHAAALGLAERCDAACIVVSEERGTISLARDGRLRVVPTPDVLLGELRAPHGDAAGAPVRWTRRALIDAGLAVVASLVLWLAFVPGSESGSVRVPARVGVTNLPDDLALESVSPAEVEVTLRGLRRDLLLLGRDEVAVTIDAYLARLGRRTFAVTPNDVRAPVGLEVERIEPERVRISVEATAEATGEGPSS